MPRWWLPLFWATIVFAVLYLLQRARASAIGKGRIADYEADMAAAAAVGAPSTTRSPAVTAEQLLARGNGSGPAWRWGKATFAAHVLARATGRTAAAQIGPNLTDDYWIHGGTPARSSRR